MFKDTVQLPEMNHVSSNRSISVQSPSVVNYFIS